MNRTLLSYDDITASGFPSPSAVGERQTKRAKRDGLSGSHGPTKSETILPSHGSHPHWDDTNEHANVTVNYGDGDELNIVSASTSVSATNGTSLNSNQPLRTASTRKRSQKKKRGARSKILGEIPYTEAIPPSLETGSTSWDDNQLADAWNAANEEYVRMHCTKKDWDEEATNNSSIWDAGHSKATERSIGQIHGTGTSSKANVATSEDERGKEEAQLIQIALTDPRDSDEDKGVHGHDPYLAPLPGVAYNENDAFQKAMSASYWLGYWTAIREMQQGGEQDGELVSH